MAGYRLQAPGNGVRYSPKHPDTPLSPRSYNLASMKPRTELSTLRNIGATIEKRLNEIGVLTREDLQRLGPLEAYRRIHAKSAGRTVPVCYYLYSLQGALMDLHWDDVPDHIKTALRQEALAKTPRRGDRSPSSQTADSASNIT